MNKIKTTKTVILAALVVAGSLFTSCSKDDDNKDAPIVGKWKEISSVEETFVNNVSTNTSEDDIDENNYDNYEFKSDGKFINTYSESDPSNGQEVVNVYTGEGTYTISGTKLSYIYDEDSDIEIYEFSVNNNKLITIFTEENSESDTKYVYTTTYNRQ